MFTHHMWRNEDCFDFQHTLWWSKFCIWLLCIGMQDLRVHFVCKIVVNSLVLHLLQNRQPHENFVTKQIKLAIDSKCTTNQCEHFQSFVQRRFECLFIGWQFCLSFVQLYHPRRLNVLCFQSHKVYSIKMCPRFKVAPFHSHSLSLSPFVCVLLSPVSSSNRLNSSINFRPFATNPCRPIESQHQISVKSAGINALQHNPYATHNLW